MKTIKKIEKWFDLRISWFFVNGRKIDEYNKRLEEKYKNKMVH